VAEANDPPRDLNNDVCSVKLEADESESAKNRKIEFFSSMLEADPSEEVRLTVRPWKSELARLNEPVSDLW
jgi:hypothetical protein